MQMLTRKSRMFLNGQFVSIKHSRKKKKSRKLGQQPPAQPIGKIAAPEEREPPTWGTNLVEVIDIPKFEEKERVQPSTDTMPKKTEFKPQIQPYDSDLSDMHDTLQDFAEGEISKSPRKRLKEVSPLTGN